jgi:hypothetical protein
MPEPGGRLRGYSRLTFERGERVVDDWLTREAPLARAERYRKVAVQYSDFAGACISPFLRGFYRRIAEDYLARAEVALRAAETDARRDET